MGKAPVGEVGGNRRFPPPERFSSVSADPAALALPLAFCGAATARCSRNAAQNLKKPLEGEATFWSPETTTKIDQALSAQQKKQYVSYRHDDASKAAAEEAAGLSGVPVSQVQEDLVRDRRLGA